MTILRIGKFVGILFLLAASMPSCVASTKPDGELDLSMKRRGVIGEPSFLEEPVPAELEEIDRAVGMIWVNDNIAGEERNTFGTATMLTDRRNRQSYLLTNKHLVYNYETGHREASSVTWLNERSGSIVDIDLTLVPETANPVTLGSDFLLLPILYKESEGVDLNQVGSFPLSGSGVVERMVPTYSVSVLQDRDYVKRVFQKGFSLISEHSHGRQVWITDMDGYGGFSGSPIILIDSQGDAHIMGLFSGSSRHEDCRDGDERRCFNAVTRLDGVEWFE